MQLSEVDSNKKRQISDVYVDVDVDVDWSTRTFVCLLEVGCGSKERNGHLS